MENEGEIIIECGVDGGSWTLLGRRGALGGWRFRATRNEAVIYDLLREEDREGFEPYEETPWVVSWEAALALFDKYPWASFFYPLRVHPEFAERIWEAVQERCGAGEQGERGYNLKEWYRLCHGGAASNDPL